LQQLISNINLINTSQNFLVLKLIAIFGGKFFVIFFEKKTSIDDFYTWKKQTQLP